ncbi:acyl-CoA dehydrogenase family protein [Fulvivirgaceae bacterium BMA10]|uniref:Acyl-CoA dehydrogenase family protein n=1 Tax=Splendidivirga corallicola TaxID=3051826 RepID=A0ABT8KLC5_9BACT|nr:acyl-CoA dehydrogenase family protein [Fulvivirgaceae bacterium BMA10]
MTKEEKKDLIETCSSLSKKFAERASEYDRKATWPVKDYEDIKNAGLLGIMVPKDKGGLGADFLTYTKSLEQLSTGGASTGLTFNMHNITAGILSESETKDIGGSRGKAMNDFRDWALGEIVNERKMFASANSEPGIGAHFSALKTTYKKVDGGYIINGYKLFVSMLGYADYYVVAARREQSSGDLPEISFFIVELDNPGIEIEEIWDTLGMRATVSNNMRLKDCFVPNDKLFLGTEGLGIFKLTREPHWVIGGYVGTYLGICQATFDYMISHLKKKKIPGTDQSVINRDWVQRDVGRLAVELEGARALVYKAAKMVDEHRGKPETNVAIHHSKYAVSELAPRLASDAIRLCGGSGIAKSLPLERFYRDARCGGLMPATSDECLLYAGKSALGFDLTQIKETYW